MNRLSAIALAGILALSQVACTKDQVTATLGALVNAAATFEDTTNPQDAPIVNAVVNTCIDPALTILAGAGTGLSKTEAIGLNCDPLVASLSSNPRLGALLAALNTFLNSVKTLTAEAVSTPAGAFAFANSTEAAKPAKVDQKKLRELRKQVDAMKAKIAARGGGK